MARRVRRGFLALVVLAFLFPFGLQNQLLAQDATPAASSHATPVAGAASEAITLFASAIPNPRDFIRGADGSMIVASGGIGGTAVFPADQSGAIFRSKGGYPVTLASGFPSASAFGGRHGISDVAILSGTLESPALGPAVTAPSPGAPAATGAMAVNIANMAFSPATVTIPVGTKVTRTNAEPVAHTVTATGGGFNSGRLNTGQTFTHTFETAGTFDHQCTCHPYMKGTIIVR